MNKLVKVISSRISNKIRFVKFLGMGKSDVQEKRDVLPFGIDSAPLKDVIALTVETSEIGKNVVVGYINKQQIAKAGESRLFSTDESGELAISIHLKNDGTAEIGGDSDNLMRYSELKSAFDELKSDFNDHIAAYNSHIHVTTATVGASAVPGVLTPTASSSTPSTADMSGAKINELKCS